MREIRVFTDQPLAIGSEVTLEDQVARHLGAVLRLKNGDPVTLFNGQGGEYPSHLTDCSSKRARAQILDYIAVDRESPLSIHLGIGLSRGDRMDWAIQKATEAGVSEITPLYTERTEVKLKNDRREKKLSHWQHIVASACEQCYRNRLPVIHEPTSLQTWLNEISTDKKLVLHHRSEQTLKQLHAETPSSVALLIGPEGGLSPDEIDTAIQHDFEPLTLGPRIFRTETAPVIAITILQSVWGDFT
ncbi:MAG: 16S rRNA (uracil(1498)-N(3))-methyltransferase [Gammaproteobacteria bacterium]|nr:MAG: 16S rRNA (uracil(1498)-N(3))-methyltransferase [Gammaproteobacteria bacterium]